MIPRAFLFFFPASVLTFTPSPAQKHLKTTSLDPSTLQGPSPPHCHLTKPPALTCPDRSCLSNDPDAVLNPSSTRGIMPWMHLVTYAAFSALLCAAEESAAVSTVSEEEACDV